MKILIWMEDAAELTQEGPEKNLLLAMAGAGGENSITNRLERIERKLCTMDNELQKRIDDMTAAVTSETTVEESTEVLLQQITSALTAATAKANAAGATPAQLQSLTDLTTLMTQRQAKLAAAVTANTPLPATA